MEDAMTLCTASLVKRVVEVELVGPLMILYVSDNGLVHFEPTTQHTSIDRKECRIVY